MATDATGTPTSLGIPKFNTAADAPSGLGTNAMMDSIDTLTAARVVKPSGIVSGEVPVWNGSSWDRSSVTQIAQSAFTAWTAYSPVWAATGVAPVLNNGTLTGKYAQIGKTVIGRLLLTAGSGTTFGTGNWTFTLPVAAAASESIGLGAIGTALAAHTGLSAWTGETVFQTTTTVAVYTNAQPAAVVTNTTPFTWASTDTFAVRFTYEAA